MVKWHTPEERRQIKLRLRDRGFCLFEDCVGFLDGTMFAFKWKPYPDERLVTYFNHRKKAYGLQAPLICDNLGRILHFSLLFPDSAHDACCWRATQIARHPGMSGQWLIVPALVECG